VWEWVKSFRTRVCDDYSPATVEAYVQQAIAHPGNERTWAVWRDGELGGLISFQSWNPIAGITHCLFKRSFWGPDTTHTALRLAYDEVFASGVQTVNAFVFEDNHPIRALAKRLGARELRDPIQKFTMRGGEPVNAVVIQLSKESFYALSPRLQNHNDLQHNAHVHGGAVGPAIASGEHAIVRIGERRDLPAAAENGSDRQYE
jgi:RimJ/RimL family protein N-acetyltransferase